MAHGTGPRRQRKLHPRRAHPGNLRSHRARHVLASGNHQLTQVPRVCARSERTLSDSLKNSTNKWNGRPGGTRTRDLYCVNLPPLTDATAKYAKTISARDVSGGALTGEEGEW